MLQVCYVRLICDCLIHNAACIRAPMVMQLRPQRECILRKLGHTLLLFPEQVFEITCAVQCAMRGTPGGCFLQVL